MPPFINSELCTKCGRCYEACQSDVFFNSIPGQDVNVTYPEECWHCYACIEECPAGAIALRLPMTHQMMFKPV